MFGVTPIPSSSLYCPRCFMVMEYPRHQPLYCTVKRPEAGGSQHLARRETQEVPGQGFLLEAGQPLAVSGSSRWSFPSLQEQVAPVPTLPTIHTTAPATQLFTIKGFLITSPAQLAQGHGDTGPASGRLSERRGTDYVLLGLIAESKFIRNKLNQPSHNTGKPFIKHLLTINYSPVIKCR